jgi:hypothetical protein
MFHEILLAPLKQTNTFRSPDVALLPLVAGSTQAVTTPLWTPGLCCVVLAPAIAVTAVNETTTAAASSFVDGDLTIRAPSLFSPGADDPLPRIGFSKAGQEVAQVERFTAIQGYRRTGTHPWL